MNYSVIGIDQSMTSTGWGHIRQGDTVPTWGLKSLPPWGDDEGRYLWHWFEWLGNLCVDKQVTHLFIEDTRFSHKHEETLTQLIASIGLIGQAAIVSYKLTQRGQPIEFRAVSPIDWRKTFLGAMPKPDKIDAPVWRKILKEAAVNQCNLRGWMIDKDDEADALGIMTYGVCTIDKSFLHAQGALFRKAENLHNQKVSEAQ